MTFDDLHLAKYQTLDCKRFKHWVWLQDRSSGLISARQKRKNLRKYIESIIGVLTARWQYQECDDHCYIIKLDDERDLVIFLLKFKKN
jgi:hypothetical protein